MIVYEYPFNERIRTLLRLEDLYEKFAFFISHDHPQHHHVALSTIFEMLEVAGRADALSVPARAQRLGRVFHYP